MEFHVCQNVPIPCCPVSEHRLVPFTLLPQWGALMRSPSAFSSSGWTVSTYSVSTCTADSSTSSSPSLGSLQYVHAFLVLGSPELVPARPTCPTSAEQRGRATCPQLIEVPLLQSQVPYSPRCIVAAFAIRVHCWLRLMLIHDAWCVLCTLSYMLCSSDWYLIISLAQVPSYPWHTEASPDWKFSWS